MAKHYDYKKFWKDRAEKEGGIYVSRKGITNDKWMKEWAEWEEWFRRYVEADGKTVMDYGCGIGRFDKMFHELNCYDYIGLDIVQKSLDIAYKNNSASSRFYLINPDKKQFIPFDDNQFDVIWTCTVLQHIVDPVILQNVISEFKRVLKPGGKFYLFENTYVLPEGVKGAINMDFRTVEDYEKLLGVKLKVQFKLYDTGNEEHTFMEGVFNEIRATIKNNQT